MIIYNYPRSDVGMYYIKYYIHVILNLYKREEKEFDTNSP